jgi:hypothetical protein
MDVFGSCEIGSASAGVYHPELLAFLIFVTINDLCYDPLGAQPLL